MVEKHTQSKWLILYIKRWLTVPFIMSDGTVVERKAGTGSAATVVVPHAGTWIEMMQRFIKI